MGHMAKARAISMTAKGPTEGSRSPLMAPVLTKDQHEKTVKMPHLKRCDWDQTGRGKENVCAVLMHKLVSKTAVFTANAFVDWAFAVP